VPRALKTYVTSVGFFELAIAAPSMKAALEAWGMSHNAFQQGFAKQTDEPKVVAATIAKPGVVLKRAVGTHGEFQEDAELPTTLPNVKAPKAEPRRPYKKTPKPKAKRSERPNPAAIISFEKERAKRLKQSAQEEARNLKIRAQRQRATETAKSALNAALVKHEKELALMEREQDKVDRRKKREQDRWESERKRLEAALGDAKG
jgi:colicin import membrane protein